MAVRFAPAARSPPKAQRELEDLQLAVKGRNGEKGGLGARIGRCPSLVHLKAGSYFLVGGDGEDLVQEGLIGLYKAVRDFRPDKERCAPQAIQPCERAEKGMRSWLD